MAKSIADKLAEAKARRVEIVAEMDASEKVDTSTFGAGGREMFDEMCDSLCEQMYRCDDEIAYLFSKLNA